MHGDVLYVFLFLDWFVAVYYLSYLLIHFCFILLILFIRFAVLMIIMVGNNKDEDDNDDYEGNEDGNN